MQNKKVLWMTRTALLLALLIVLQWATKPLGQAVTGPCVNLILAVAAMTAGLPAGLTVALLSPIFAWLLGIAPLAVTVPAIMAGNAVFVCLLYFLCAKTEKWHFQVLGLAAAAAGKFGVLFSLVQWVICGAALPFLKGQGIKVPVATLAVNFGWLQLLTAVIGGAAGLALLPVLKKALKNG